MKRRLILLAWYRHWRAFWFHQWKWAWTFYAGRGTTDQQRHCCIRCWRQLTWSRCEDPWRCICCSNALPKDIKHFPGLQQRRLLALHFWTTSVFDGWIVFGPDSLKAGTRSNGAKVNVVSCYIWHHYLPPGRASWRTMRTRVTCFCFLFFINWKKNSSFSQNTRLHLRWQRGLIIHNFFIDLNRMSGCMHPWKVRHTSISSYYRRR